MAGSVSRTRLIRPEFFSDARIASAPVSVRYFYIGLWTLCDDAGFFELDAAQIAAELYRFDSRARRERAVRDGLARLVELDRVRYLECGHHAVIPTLPDHRIKGGEALFTVQKRHERRCSVGLRRTTENSVSVSVSESGSVYESGSPVLKARNLRDVSKDVGGFVATLASRKPA